MQKSLRGTKGYGSNGLCVGRLVVTLLCDAVFKPSASLSRRARTDGITAATSATAQHQPPTSDNFGPGFSSDNAGDGPSKGPNFAYYVLLSCGYPKEKSQRKVWREGIYPGTEGTWAIISSLISKKSMNFQKGASTLKEAQQTFLEAMSYDDQDLLNWETKVPGDVRSFYNNTRRTPPMYDKEGRLTNPDVCRQELTIFSKYTYLEYTKREKDGSLRTSPPQQPPRQESRTEERYGQASPRHLGQRSQSKNTDYDAEEDDDDEGASFRELIPRTSNSSRTRSPPRRRTKADGRELRDDGSRSRSRERQRNDTPAVSSARSRDSQQRDRRAALRDNEGRDNGRHMSQTRCTDREGARRHHDRDDGHA